MSTEAQYALLGLVIFGAAVSIAALLYSIRVPTYRIWPVTSSDGPSPALRSFLNRTMGRVFGASSIPLVAVSVFDFGSIGLPLWLHLLVGAGLFASGGAFAIAGVGTLGFDITMGNAGALEVRGPYRFSRNPQYVGTVGVLLGVALLSNSWLSLLGGSTWCIWYLLAPFAEESWLRTQVGDAYDDYRSRTRRFL